MADIQEDSAHVHIYCQNCGYEAKHRRKNASLRPVQTPKPQPGLVLSKSRKKRKKGSIQPLRRAS